MTLMLSTFKGMSPNLVYLLNVPRELERLWAMGCFQMEESVKVQ